MVSNPEEDGQDQMVYQHNEDLVIHLHILQAQNTNRKGCARYTQRK
jgi:hypothetical protein